MALLGTPLLVLLAVLAVGLPFAAVLLWSRVRGPRALQAAQRGGLLAAAQIAAVMLVAVALNDYGNFYGSWSSLLRAQSQHARVSAGNGPAGVHSSRPPHQPPAASGQIEQLPDPAYATHAQWPVLGRLESVMIRGASSGLKEHAYVYLPPQYFQSQYAGSRFPAMEVLTGYPGSDADMIHGMNYPGVLLSLITQHQTQPTVLVMLRPSVNYPRDTECTNVPAGPQAETFYASDLPSQVSHSYRVRPTGWGAIGGSLGGYCAAKLTMLHPTVFYAGVSIQGYYTARRDSTTGDLWGGSLVLRHLNDLEWRLGHMPPPPISLLVQSTLDQQGPYGYQDTERFTALVKKPMAVQMTMYQHGGHNIATWRIGLAQELSWLSAKLPAVVKAS